MSHSLPQSRSQSVTPREYERKQAEELARAILNDPAWEGDDGMAAKILAREVLAPRSETGTTYDDGLERAAAECELRASVPKVYGDPGHEAARCETAAVLAKRIRDLKGKP